MDFIIYVERISRCLERKLVGRFGIRGRRIQVSSVMVCLNTNIFFF